MRLNIDSWNLDFWNAGEGTCGAATPGAAAPDAVILNSHGARPVHLIITMIKWIRTSRLSIKNSLFGMQAKEVAEQRHKEQQHLTQQY